jgi:hypothetical protein
MARPFIGGYRRDLEDVDALEKSAIILPEFTGYKAATPVAEPWKLIKAENQSSQGSCQGCAVSTVDEKCILDGTGEVVALSKQFAYIETQRIDGLIGSDRGSTIWGGVQLSKTRGIPPENYWEYTGRYHTKPPQYSIEECYAAAAKYKVENHVKMTGYDSIRSFLEQGLGGVSIGIQWNNSCEAKVTGDYQNRGGGGHAISLLFVSPRVASDGRNFIWMCNSWGTNWCNNGWSEWSPRFVDGLFQSRYTVAYGLTDMSNPEPRPVNYIGRMG